jgi:ParB family chromosome partitioning protein
MRARSRDVGRDAPADLRDHSGADTLAEAVSLDMTAFCEPSARTYLGRVPKACIPEAVRESASEQAARMADIKKRQMAEGA